MEIAREDACRKFAQVGLEQARDCVRIPVFIRTEEIDVTLWKGLKQTSAPRVCSVGNGQNLTVIESILQRLDHSGATAQTVNTLLLVRLLSLQILYASEDDRW